MLITFCIGGGPLTRVKPQQLHVRMEAVRQIRVELEGKQTSRLRAATG